LLIDSYVKFSTFYSIYLQV